MDTEVQAYFLFNLFQWIGKEMILYSASEITLKWTNNSDSDHETNISSFVDFGDYKH